MAVVLILAAGFGTIAGLAFGFAQWLALRKHAKRSRTWIIGNAIGWALALSVIYFGASLPTQLWSATLVVLVGAMTGIAAGLMIGAVTGISLIWILREHFGSQR